METKTLLLSMACAVSVFMSTGSAAVAQGAPQRPEAPIVLPNPRYEGKLSLETVLLRRRSLRRYTGAPLTLAEVSQLLWAAQGITHPIGRRTAPSAGALYPLELYLVAGSVEGLRTGIYRYRPRQHALIVTGKRDRRADLSSAALGQSWIKAGAAIIVIAAVYERTTRKYGHRGVRYVHIEAGHVGQNIYLQAVSLNLGTVYVGAFNDRQVKEILNLRKSEEPLGLMPLGRRK